MLSVRVCVLVWVCVKSESECYLSTAVCLLSLRLKFLQCCYLSLPISFLLLYLTFVFNAYHAVLLSGLLYIFFFSFASLMRYVLAFSVFFFIYLGLFHLHLSEMEENRFEAIACRRLVAWIHLKCNANRLPWYVDLCSNSIYVRAKHNSTFIMIRWAYDMWTCLSLFETVLVDLW